jgi:serine/threonine protein kinase
VLALEHLHKSNIAYKDLCPDNILLDEVGHVKLTDWSMTKFASDEGFALSFGGSPEYLAPEIVSCDT